MAIQWFRESARVLGRCVLCVRGDYGIHEVQFIDGFPYGLYFSRGV